MVTITPAEETVSVGDTLYKRIALFRRITGLRAADMFDGRIDLSPHHEMPAREEAVIDHFNRLTWGGVSPSVAFNFSAIPKYRAMARAELGAGVDLVRSHTMCADTEALANALNEVFNHEGVIPRGIRQSLVLNRSMCGGLIGIRQKPYVSVEMNAQFLDNDTWWHYVEQHEQQIASAIADARLKYRSPIRTQPRTH